MARKSAVLATVGIAGPVASGIIALVLAPAPGSTFGWFAYSPLQDVRTSSVIVTNWQQCLGVALIVVGLLVAAAVYGYLLGRLRADPS